MAKLNSTPPAASLENRKLGCIGSLGDLLGCQVPEGFFAGPEDLAGYVEKLEALNRDPDRKDLRWQLDIDDDVLSDEVRQLEFRNWIQKVVLPRAAGA